MTPREFVETELQLIRRVWTEQKALNATCVFIKNDGRVMVPCQFRNDVEKDAYSDAIRIMVKATDPDVVVYWAEAWALTVPTEDKDKPRPRPSKHKDRVEILMVQIEFKSGEKFCCTADIIRTGKEVKLSEFKVMDAADSMGRFVDFYPIRGKDKN